MKHLFLTLTYSICRVARKFLAAIKAGKDIACDLSTVVHVFNAAEPIESETLTEFAEIFGPYGFSASAIVPGYGLAEHTVYVCDGGKQILRVSRTTLECQSKIHVVDEDDTNCSRRLCVPRLRDK